MFLTPDIENAVAGRFSSLLSGAGDGPVAVAVSGGGDSTALLALAAKWREQSNRQVLAVSVDHRLRPEAMAELQQVAELAAELGIPHTILTWQDWDGTGNLQDTAREARRSLIRDWAKTQGVVAVATGHNLDDQAETVLMRLARGSGVDGLAAMYPQEEFDGLNWIKPLLNLSRQELRAYLSERKIDWSEDPSNKDPSFDRVRFRQAAKVLADLGLDAKTLASTAKRMKNARHALEVATLDLAQEVAEPTDIGSVKLDREKFAAAPYEVQARLLAHALRWISRQQYRPRLDALEQALAAVLAGRNFTLHGCLVAAGKGRFLEVCREPAAIPICPARSGLFDQRWQVRIGDVPGDATLGPLGEAGLSALPDWRATGHSRWALLGAPSLWQKDELIAAPFVVTSDTCEVLLVPDVENFFTSILTH
jgi:tRNA(Ile)-lysidine synthase